MDSALIDQTSEQFLGQWKRLVSTTNWEKGSIIHGWRTALLESGAPAAEYSDDVWSRRVGNVTPQHVGRLRRVYERFFDVHEDYDGLYWSHFQAALDWDDAEMWLEGAVQNGWSIAEMRHQRFEARGGMAETESYEEGEAADSGWDEDADTDAETTSGTLGVVQAHDRTEPVDEQESDDELAGYDHAQFDEPSDDESDDPAREPVRPFAALPPLPSDVADAFESYKLCILRHKLAGWQEISRDDMLVSLDSLKQLALAPAADG